MNKILICFLCFNGLSLPVMAAKISERSQMSGWDYLVKQRQYRAMENIRRRWGHNEVLDKNRAQLEESRGDEKSYFSWERHREN
jgi:hypothetical protein